MAGRKRKASGGGCGTLLLLGIAVSYLADAGADIWVALLVVAAIVVGLWLLWRWLSRPKTPTAQELAAPHTRSRKTIGAWFRASRSGASPASTYVTSEQDLGAIKRELWAESTDVDFLQALFYPNGPGVDTTDTGTAYLSEAAARNVISFLYAASANGDIEGQVEEAMSNDGIYVIPVEAMIDEIIEEECAKWDTTALGTPPPEWDCPGY